MTTGPHSRAGSGAIIEGGTYIRRPLTSPRGYTPRQVAQAYHYPENATGRGRVGGIIELGGGFGQADLDAYFGSLSLPVPDVTAKLVGSGRNQSDGVNGADAEVLLDIEVAGAVAPGAKFIVYFGGNNDADFAACIEAAVADGCDGISISWGSAEANWPRASIKAMEAAFAAAKAAGTQVFCASGDSGSSDSTRGNAVDYPASSPDTCGCGGTRLLLNAAGERDSEVVWNDNPKTSATGGGDSVLFPGRGVPDVAGNADPETGYQTLTDGQRMVVGGTSAVAPLYLGLLLRLLELTGERFDFVQAVAGHATVCFDVTSGNNGAQRAGPGRDKATGFGVVDGELLLAVLQATSQPAPAPAPTPAPAPAPADAAVQALAAAIPASWVDGRHMGEAGRVAEALKVFFASEGVTPAG